MTGNAGIGVGVERVAFGRIEFKLAIVSSRAVHFNVRAVMGTVVRAHRHECSRNRTLRVAAASRKFVLDAHIGNCNSRIPPPANVTVSRYIKTLVNRKNGFNGIRKTPVCNAKNKIATTTAKSAVAPSKISRPAPAVATSPTLEFS